MVLKKKLTFWLLVVLGANAIIGSGLFLSPSIAATYAGPASLIGWVIAAALSLVMGACFAELSGMFPRSGGVYEYTKRAFGEFTGFSVGWAAWVVANITIAMLTIAGIQFLSLLVPLETVPRLGIALAFVVAFNYISFRGIELSGKVLLVFSAITLFTILALIFGAAPSVDLSNAEPFFIFGEASVFIALFLVMQTFFGWEAISFLAEETRNASKVIPKVMLLSTALVAVLVVAGAFVALTATDWSDLTQATPLIVATSLFDQKLVSVFAALAFFSMMGSAAAWIISTPRLIFAMAREGDLPANLSELHPRNRTPYNAIAFQTVITGLVLLSGSYELLLRVGLPVAVIMYVLIALSIPRLRHTMPTLKRAFTLPMPRLLTTIAVLLMVLVVVLGSTVQDIVLGGTLFLLGLPLYFIGTLGYSKGMIRRFSDRLARLTQMTYGPLVEQQVLSHLLNYLDDVTVRKVLDVGCGIGRVTNKVAKHSIPVSGKVYGVDFSERELGLARRYAEEHDVRNVEFLKADLYNLNRSSAGRKLKNLDAVIGVGVLQYLPKVEPVLKDLGGRVRKEGKVYFIDYDYRSRIFDKPWIENDDEIRELFRKAGFKVKVWRQKRPLWTYVHIYGRKR
jgi:amino acid transporter